MKKSLALLILMSMISLAFAERFVMFKPINQTRIDLTSSTVLESITINPTETGKVIVRFDGNCVSNVGDRIILAASNDGTWGVNDGNTSVEAASSDYNQNSFSHTRVYEVTAGSHTYSAVAHNYVETDGNGEASIYGSLTVEFIPDAQFQVKSVGISATNINLTTETVLDQLAITSRFNGKVIVRFDGKVISTPGDRIVVAASDEPEWNVNDGNVNFEAVDADYNRNAFSHTRVYDFTAGTQNYYAVAQNYVETDGDGIASIYGTLTVEFIPDGSMPTYFSPISATKVDLNTETSLAQVTFITREPGKAIVTFDGMCIPSVGDRIVLAASDNGSWGVNDGAVGTEAYDADVDHKSFSHSRVYEINEGTHTFHAVGHNYVETAGDGIASIYGGLSVKFIPRSITKLEDEVTSSLSLYPNPVTNILNIDLAPQVGNGGSIEVLDMMGRMVKTLPLNGNKAQVDVSGLQKGAYIIQLKDEEGHKLGSNKFIKQ
ncbi:MAG: T9SS type A sorting domain-containing protein [Bacteroidota bacterium]